MRSLPVAFILLVVLAACGPSKPTGAAAVVNQLYEPYVHPDQAKPAEIAKSPLLAKRLTDKITTGVAFGRMLNEPVLDFDPVIWAQDGAVSKLTLKTTTATDDEAHVVASFDLSGQAKTVEYDLVNDEGAWKIANIASGGQDLPAAIDQAMKPAGDEAAMRAPVEAVYAKYLAAKGKAVPPLHSWAPLSKSFAALAAQAAAKGKTLGPDLPGFDPVVSGPRAEIKIQYYQAARSAVLANIERAGGSYTLIYPLVQEDGAWKIDNIRSAGSYTVGAWDVREKLAADGIK